MSCGECKACCILFPIAEIDKPINTLCKYYDKGCSIHESKPKMCADYECAYIQAKTAPLELRPDKSGIVFNKKTDNIFSGILIPNAKCTDTARGQIKSFNDQGYSVVLVSLNEEKPHLMLSDGHNSEDVMREYKEVLSGNI